MATIKLTTVLFNSHFAQWARLIPYRDDLLIGTLVLKKDSEIYDPYVDMNKYDDGLKMTFSKTDRQMLSLSDYLDSLFYVLTRD